MAKRRAKKKSESGLGVILDFVDVTDTIFARLTGKSIAAWLEEFRQQPKELPSGEQESTMSLANAYAALGLPQTATIEEVKRNYKNLAAVFHPDKGGYKEAMILLNNAYHEVMKAKRG